MATQGELDPVLAQDPAGRVACEMLITTTSATLNCFLHFGEAC